MTNFEEVLHPEDVNLGLKATDKAAAVEEVLAMLNGDERISNWASLREAVIERDAPELFQHGVGICIAHGRCSAVKGLVLAAGRSDSGVTSPDFPEAIRLVFVAGIPKTFDSEYLRVVGAIARICRDADFLSFLLSSADGESFVTVLEEALISM